VFGISDYPAFVAAVCVFLAIPGPGTLALLAATGRGGFRAGAAAALGLIVADQVLLWLAVLGVAAVLQTHPGWFQALQYAGAAYLCWVGLTLLFGRGRASMQAPEPSRRFWRQGFLVTLMNPKAIVFFMAFLPLFIDPARHQGLLTFAAMAVTIAVIAAVYFLLLCAFAGALAARLRERRRIGEWLRRAAGGALVGFGIRLGTQ
jgi:threonine/homoserine/homoserine lactone efflux protein